MRSAIITLLLILAGAAAADELSSGLSPPTGAEIIDLNGCRVARVFAKCGYPTGVFPSTDGKKRPTVCLEYDGYMFETRQKGVVGCYVYAPYAGEVLGCKIGDTPEDVIKKLGRPRLEGKVKDGKQTMLWDFKDQDQDLQINFENNKCKLFVIAVKD